MDFHYRLVNVFAESTFGGNPLCVFEDARGLSDAQMQAIALQFNLSETVFILPSERATARMRIFTTGYEMPFAGHPTLGAAHVVRHLLKTGDAISLECKAGIVPVQSTPNDSDIWTFTAPVQGLPETVKCALPGTAVAAMLGLQVSDLLDEPLWVNTGTDQLLVPLRTTEAVRRAQPDSSRLADWPPSSLGRKTAYVFAWDDHVPSANERLAITSRYFFTKQGGGVAEDPGTGSACANLGGWWIAQRRSLPVSIQINQGEQVQRPSCLYLDVSPEFDICVGGRVIELGRGVINLG
ncbi:PhzF family phenazine biosynthesis protein [Undibacterium sp. Di24W]|uniref:PhzF family phenazine biosynthesis protein n=1 Tax=Undibacterium sp. Di24W TaxID=3413033 RepID=UPI003BF00B67